MRKSKDKPLMDKWKKALDKKNELIDMLNNNASLEELNSKGHFFSSPKHDLHL